MNGEVPAGQPASIEVSYSDPGLFVGLQLFDDSGVSPVAVGAIIPMLNWAGVAYRAKVSGVANKWYLYQIAAYTDNTYTTVDGNQPNGSGTLFFKAPDLSGKSITGFITVAPKLTGFVRCS